MDGSISSNDGTNEKKTDDLLGPPGFLLKVCRLTIRNLSQEMLQFICRSKLTSEDYKLNLLNIKKLREHYE